MLTIGGRSGTRVARVSGKKMPDKFIKLDNRDGSMNIGRLTGNYFKKRGLKLNKGQLDALDYSLKNKSTPEDEKMAEIYKDAVEYISNVKSTEVVVPDGMRAEPLPSLKTVEKLYVAGPSGSGKSTYIANWLKEYKRMFPENPIYLFSTVTEDEVLDKLDPVRIPLDEELLLEPIQPEDIADSVCIFDDVDTVQDASIRKYISGLRDWLLECGRHHRIRLCMTSHNLSNYKATRLQLLEATSVTFFPRAGATFQLKNFLKTYGGMDDRQIQRVLRLPSRWVTMYKSYPMFILYEKGAFLLD